MTLGAENLLNRLEKVSQNDSMTILRYTDLFLTNF